MSINVEKINSLLKSSDFVEKLKSDLSEEGIIKVFGDEGVDLGTKEAQEFKNIILDVKQKIKEEGLENVVGGFGVKSALNNVNKGSEAFYSLSKDAGFVLGKTLGGFARGTWGTLQLPVAIVWDAGKGVYKGIKESLKD